MWRNIAFSFLQMIYNIGAAKDLIANKGFTTIVSANIQRWNSLEKGSIFDDALDDKEYEGNLIYLLNSGSEFIRNNSKVRFVKKAQYRVDKPDYAERAVTEALVNALIHRDYVAHGLHPFQIFAHFVRRHAMDHVPICEVTMGMLAMPKYF